MSAFAKLQSVNSAKPYYGFTKLTIGYYEIKNFKLVKNKFGQKGSNEKTLLIELDDQVLFLPRYFAENINEKDVISLNTDDETKYLHFGGQRENK